MLQEVRREHGRDGGHDGRGDGRDVAGEGTDRIPALEWVVATLGAALVIGTTGYMLVQSTADDGETVPAVSVTVDSIVSSGGGWVVRFTAENSARATAAGLQVVGTLRTGQAEPEESQATIDYLPGRSTRGGGLFFSADPRRGDLVVRPTGYQEP